MFVWYDSVSYKFVQSSKNKWIIYAPNPKQGLEVWVDAGFAVGWNLVDTDNADNIYSWTGFIIY
jgi:hypothetical protein